MLSRLSGFFSQVGNALSSTFIRRTLEPWVLELQPNQVTDFDASSGRCQLKRLRFRPEKINPYLEDSGFTVVSLEVKNVSANVPWSHILHKRAKLVISNVVLTVTPRDPNQPPSAAAVVAMTDMNKTVVHLNTQAVEDASPTMRLFSDLFSHISHQLEFSFENLVVCVQHLSPSLNRRVSVLLTIPSLQFTDATTDRNEACFDSRIRFSGISIELLQDHERSMTSSIIDNMRSGHSTVVRSVVLCSENPTNVEVLDVSVTRTPIAATATATASPSVNRAPNTAAAASAGAASASGPIATDSLEISGKLGSYMMFISPRHAQILLELLPARPKPETPPGEAPPELLAIPTIDPRLVSMGPAGGGPGAPLESPLAEPSQSASITTSSASHDSSGSEYYSPDEDFQDCQDDDDDDGGIDQLPSTPTPASGERRRSVDLLLGGGGGGRSGEAGGTPGATASGSAGSGTSASLAATTRLNAVLSVQVERMRFSLIYDSEATVAYQQGFAVPQVDADRIDLQIGRIALKYEANTKETGFLSVHSLSASEVLYAFDRDGNRDSAKSSIFYFRSTDVCSEEETDGAADDGADEFDPQPNIKIHFAVTPNFTGPFIMRDTELKIETRGLYIELDPYIIERMQNYQVLFDCFIPSGGAPSSPSSPPAPATGSDEVPMFLPQVYSESDEGQEAVMPRTSISVHLDLLRITMNGLSDGDYRRTKKRYSGASLVFDCLAVALTTDQLAGASANVWVIDFAQLQVSTRGSILQQSDHGASAVLLYTQETDGIRPAIELTIRSPNSVAEAFAASFVDSTASFVDSRMSFEAEPDDRARRQGSSAPQFMRYNLSASLFQIDRPASPFSSTEANDQLENSDAFQHSAISASQYHIHVRLPNSNLTLTRPQYLTLVFLLNSISKYLTPHTPPPPAPPVFSAHQSTVQPPPPSAPAVRLPRVSTEIHLAKCKVALQGELFFSAKFEDVSLFMAFNYKANSSVYSHACIGSIKLSSKAMRSIPCLIKLGADKEIRVVNIVAEQVPGQPLSIGIVVQRLGVGARLHQLAADIGRFFVVPPVIVEGAPIQSISPDEAEQPFQYPNTLFRVCLLDVVVFHQSIKPKDVEDMSVNPCMALVVSSLQVRGHSNKEVGLEASFKLREATINVSKGVPSPGWFGARLFMMHVLREELGFAKVMEIDNLVGNLNLRTPELAVTLPNIETQLRARAIKCRFRCDSLLFLVHTIMDWVSLPSTSAYLDSLPNAEPSWNDIDPNVRVALEYEQHQQQLRPVTPIEPPRIATPAPQSFSPNRVVSPGVDSQSDSWSPNSLERNDSLERFPTPIYSPREGSTSTSTTTTTTTTPNAGTARNLRLSASNDEALSYGSDSDNANNATGLSVPPSPFERATLRDSDGDGVMVIDNSQSYSDDETDARVPELTIEPDDNDQQFDNGAVYRRAVEPDSPDFDGSWESVGGEESEPVVEWLTEEHEIVINDFDYFSSVPVLHDFHQLGVPPDYPATNARVTLKDLTIRIDLEEGSDFFQPPPPPQVPASSSHGSSGNRSGSGPSSAGDANIATTDDSPPSSLRICLLRFNMQFDQFHKTCNKNWRMACCISDVEVIDRMKNSAWNKFMCYNFQFLRPSGHSMVNLMLEGVDGTDYRTPEEYRFQLSLLPLRLFVDQDALLLLMCFLELDYFGTTLPTMPGAEKPPASPPASSPSATSGMASSGTSKQPDTIRFASFEIRAFKATVDYKPKYVSLSKMLSDKKEAINVAALENAHFSLDAIRLESAGLSDVKNSIDEVWAPAKQIMAYLGGLHFIRPLMGVGSGLVDLVLLPLEQFQRDGRVLRGLQKGGVSFFYALADQTLDTGARLTAKTQNVLIYAEQLLTGAPNTEAQQTSSLNAQQPESVSAGMREGMSHLTRELSAAGASIVSVPIQGYNEGVSSAVSSLFTAVPTMVLKPANAVVGALNKVFEGTLAGLHPERVQQRRYKYKQPTGKDVATKHGFTKGERVRINSGAHAGQIGFVVGYHKSATASRDGGDTPTISVPILQIQLIDQRDGEEMDAVYDIPMSELSLL